LKELLNSYKNKEIQDYLKNLTPTEATEYSLWKATKKLKQPQKPNPPIRTPQGGWARNNKEKAKVFAEHLTQVFQPHPTELKSDEEEKIQQFLESPYPLEYPLKPFKNNEIKNIISSNLNPKKAPGYNLITGKVLKELPEKGIRYITQIFNAILSTGYFPDQWKVAQVILIPKPGSVLGPILYLIYTADLPTEQNVLTATFADNTAILASHENPQTGSQILQTNLDKIQQKLLGLILTKLYWLIGRTSKLTLDNKLLVYDTVKEEIKQLSVKYSNRLNKHPNALATDLMSQPILNRRLKCFAPNDPLGRF
ncbi:hypothetical protein B7P43_G14817, partial [Cryptotermes secundus]